MRLIIPSLTVLEILVFSTVVGHLVITDLTALNDNMLSPLNPLNCLTLLIMVLALPRTDISAQLSLVIAALLISRYEASSLLSDIFLMLSASVLISLIRDSTVGATSVVMVLYTPPRCAASTLEVCWITSTFCSLPLSNISLQASRIYASLAEEGTSLAFFSCSLYSPSFSPKRSSMYGTPVW